MKKNNHKNVDKLSNSSGITLVALIVTIVVLLILASITIANITGNDAPAEKAAQAKNETEIQAEIEELQEAIDNASSKNFLHGNFSGSADAESIKTALSSFVKDTSMITGNGPWQVESASSGTKYLIKQSREVIQMPENTSTATEMGVKAGDYVNYKAGNWTQEDIDKLGNLYSGETIPNADNPYTFGGFKIGQSKDVGIIQGENNIAEIDKEHSGWRVLKINDDGSINIIHAGFSEYYYHPRYYTGKAGKSAARSQFILGGRKMEGIDDSAYNGVNERSWGMYEDNMYAQKNLSHLVKRVEMANSSGSYSFNLKWYIPDRDFWTSSGYKAGGGVMVVSGVNGNVNNYGRDTSGGIRPVVTLKAECLFQNTNDENTTTHDTQETAWTLVI